MQGNLETVTASQALIITVFSMGIVFVVLLAISYIIDLLRIFSREKVKVENKVQVIEPLKEIVNAKEEILEDDSELIAVITAAIAACSSKAMSDIKIKAIRRVQSSGNTWKEMAKQENLSN